MPASGRPGFQTDACARTLPPPLTLFALERSLSVRYPSPSYSSFRVLATGFPLPGGRSLSEPMPPLVPFMFLHKVLMGQVVVVWCLVCAVTFLCLFARFFYRLSYRSLHFFFCSENLRHVTAPPQVRLSGRPPLIVEFSQTEDCAFKCSARLCMCVSVCAALFFLQYERGDGMPPHACHAKTDPPSSQPRPFLMWG